MNDHIVRCVYFFSEEQWVPPAKHWPRYWFDKNSYSRWAVSEILDLLSNRGDTTPSKIVEDFADKMDRYACYNDTARYIFSIAREAATDILDVVRSLE